MRLINWLLFFALVILVLLFTGEEVQAREHSERWYQERHCNGQLEYKLFDKTRVDCLTHVYAQEFDFSSKWSEAVGQSLHYARLTNKKAMVVLIVEKPSGCRHAKRLLHNIDYYSLPITVQLIGAGAPCDKELKI